MPELAHSLMSLGRDVMAPERQIKQRVKMPTLLLSLDSNNPKDELFNSQTVMVLRKNTKRSSHSVTQPNGSKIKGVR